MITRFLPMFCLLIGTLFFFSACQKDNLSVSPEGFSYYMPIDEAGENAKPTDFVRYSEYISINDSAQWKAPGQADGPIVRELEVASKDQIENSLEYAWYDALTLMSEGDSIVLYNVLDTSMGPLPGGLEAGDTLVFYFKMLEVWDEPTWREQVNQPFTDNAYQKTESGFPYQIFNDETGTNVKEGDVVFYDQVIHLNKAMSMSSYETGKLAKTVVPSQDSINSPSPFLELIEKMSPGDSATVYWKLDILEQVPSGMSPEDVASYNIVLRKVIPNLFTYVNDYGKGKLRSGLSNAKDGLRYKVIEMGQGSIPEQGQLVAVDYVGFLPSGQMFDASYERGNPLELALGTGQVIPGWDQGLGLFPVGTKAMLFIPSELAYGEQGMPMAGIPPNTELIFYIHVLDAK